MKKEQIIIFKSIIGNILVRSDKNKISKINKSLKMLNNLIGMKKVKKTIFYQLMYFIQNLHDGKLDMLHTILQGPPGVGKTELGKILCHLYSSLGVLKNKKYIIAKRSD